MSSKKVIWGVLGAVVVLGAGSAAVLLRPLAAEDIDDASTWRLGFAIADTDTGRDVVDELVDRGDEGLRKLAELISSRRKASRNTAISSHFMLENPYARDPLFEAMPDEFDLPVQEHQFHFGYYLMAVGKNGDQEFIAPLLDRLNENVDFSLQVAVADTIIELDGGEQLREFEADNSWFTLAAARSLMSVVPENSADIMDRIIQSAKSADIEPTDNYVKTQKDPIHVVMWMQSIDRQEYIDSLAASDNEIARNISARFSGNFSTGMNPVPRWVENCDSITSCQQVIEDTSMVQEPMRAAIALAKLLELDPTAETRSFVQNKCELMLDAYWKNGVGITNAIPFVVLLFNDTDSSSWDIAASYVSESPEGLTLLSRQSATTMKGTKADALIAQYLLGMNGRDQAYRLSRWSEWFVVHEGNEMRDWAMKAVNSPYSFTKAAAWKVLAHTDPGFVSDELERLVTLPHARKRLLAADICRILGEEAPVSVLKRLHKDNRYRVRLAVAKALVNDARPEAMELLEKLKSDTSISVQQTAHGA